MQNHNIDTAVQSPKRATYEIQNVGLCHITYTEERLLSVKLAPKHDRNSGCSGERSPFSDDVFTQIQEYFAGMRREFDVTIDISHLTQFQQRVLHAIEQIPYAKRHSYKQLALAIGCPNAARAVGSACNRNPLHIIIPCHRVVATNGNLTGYAAGVEIKSVLLELESLNSPKKL